MWKIGILLYCKEGGGVDRCAAKSYNPEARLRDFWMLMAGSSVKHLLSHFFQTFFALKRLEWTSHKARGGRLDDFSCWHDSQRKWRSPDFQPSQWYGRRHKPFTLSKFMHACQAPAMLCISSSIASFSTSEGEDEGFSKIIVNYWRRNCISVRKKGELQAVYWSRGRMW